MALDTNWDRWHSRSAPADEIIDESFDLDAFAGDRLVGDSDPHYADLPCYVPLVDEDETIDPFAELVEEI